MSSADPGLHAVPNIQAQTVLVVEEEIFVRSALGDFLRTCGLHVIEAANAAEAIRVLASGTDIDLLFSDVPMPGFIDGIGLAQWVALEHPLIKVILTTGLAERAWGSTVNHVVIPKPYENHDLEARIRMLLAESCQEFPRSHANASQQELDSPGCVIP